MNAEFAIIRTGIVELNADIAAVESALAPPVAAEMLDSSQADRVARFEGLLRRTEARLFAILDSFPGH